MTFSQLKELFFRYKLHHLVFWVLYHLIWLLINIGSFNSAFDYIFHSDSNAKFFGYIIFQMLGAYFNLYYLIPKLLDRGFYKSYIFAVFATVLFCTACITLGYYLTAYQSEKTFFELFNRQPSQFMSIFLVMALPSTAASMTLAMSIKLGKKWLESERNKATLQREKLETELKYLKSQINPHFLFNTINSIFALIHKNPDLASESLASFSQMLRYQLYECNDEFVDLNRDIKFLENFIDLEKLRLDENKTELQFEFNHDNNHGHKIAPFILIPFYENAFKHISKGRGHVNFITSSLEIKGEWLELNIKNSVGEKSFQTKSMEECSGIGLKNVKRRLDLIYPAKHELIIDDQENVYDVHLKVLLQ